MPHDGTLVAYPDVGTDISSRKKTSVRKYHAKCGKHTHRTPGVWVIQLQLLAKVVEATIAVEGLLLGPSKRGSLCGKIPVFL